MANSTPSIASDSAGFLTLHWDANHGQETMVAKEVFVQMVDDINRLRAENQRMRQVFEETIRILNLGGDDAR